MRSATSREIYLELAALSWLAVNSNKPTVALYDSANCRQPKASSLSDVLVVKKGSKIRSRTEGVIPSPVPLNEMCGSRGYRPDESWPDLADLKFSKKTPLFAEGSFHVSFDGEMNGGCRDNPGKFKVSGYLYFKLDLQSGEVVFDAPQDCSDYGHE